MTAIYLMLVLNSYMFFLCMGAAVRIEETQEIIIKRLHND